jgi:hypothetical protein
MHLLSGLQHRLTRVTLPLSGRTTWSISVNIKKNKNEKKIQEQEPI